MNEMLAVLEESVENLFAEQVGPEQIRAAEQGVFASALWQEIEALGLVRPHLPESAGGAGGGWAEAFVVVRAAGRHALPLPFVETLLAAWLLQRAGLSVPTGPLALAAAPLAVEALHRERVCVALKRVAWGRRRGHAVLVLHGADGPRIACLSSAGAEVVEGNNLALEPRDTLRFVDAPIEAIAPCAIGAQAPFALGAMLRCAQMAGALEAVLERSLAYVRGREQFGRPIGSFQVIQHELAQLACGSAAASMAAQRAFLAADDARADFPGVVGVPGDPTFEAAAAKVVVGEAADRGARIAHQVHGAMGFTYEHGLHFLTRRLWAWRGEFGSERHWAGLLGRYALAEGAEGLWPAVTARTAPP